MEGVAPHPNCLPIGVPPSIERGERCKIEGAVFHRPLGMDLAAHPDNVSRLRYTIDLTSQPQAAVKLHGVFAFRQ